MNKVEDRISDGRHCYTILSTDNESSRMQNKICPYWSIRDSKPAQGNGYCGYLEWGDWDMENSVTLLWDQVKECGVNSNTALI